MRRLAYAVQEAKEPAPQGPMLLMLICIALAERGPGTGMEVRQRRGRWERRREAKGGKDQDADIDGATWWHGRLGIRVAVRKREGGLMAWHVHMELYERMVPDRGVLRSSSLACGLK